MIKVEDKIEEERSEISKEINSKPIEYKKD